MPVARDSAYASSADLPRPASPTSAATVLRPPRASSSAWSRKCSSRSRPNSTGRVYESLLQCTRELGGSREATCPALFVRSVAPTTRRTVVTTIEESALDADKLMSFVFRAVDEVGATLNAALVVMGDKLGLYRAMAGAGPLTPDELAGRTGTRERYVREWLNNQAAGGYVEYDPATGRYTLPPEQAMALTDEDSPAYLPGFFQIALGSVLDSPRITEAVKSGEGVGWHEHHHDVFEGCERFFRPGYTANLLTSWLPALDGVVEKLERGARVADVGCGHGASTILMAKAFPSSTFYGSDYHAGSIETARR